ncbi:unnamed protein product [marine sediment metagenome]|uniref:Uncharacterized protein n=1 Tax=marine sediment metagenome TaxID=412755 RepID=X1E433_9ZZZZ
MTRGIAIRPMLWGCFRMTSPLREKRIIKVARRATMETVVS